MGSNRTVRPCSRFPRSPERGPIEAQRVVEISSRTWQYFRAHLSAAPLKQYKGQYSHSSKREFPRSPERGPIEATQTAVARVQREAAHFRAHLSAAPLKQYKGQYSHSSKREFPRSPERGPIEARPVPG